MLREILTRLRLVKESLEFAMRKLGRPGYLGSWNELIHLHVEAFSVEDSRPALCKYQGAVMEADKLAR